jgi:hypothetical protein
LSMLAMTLETAVAATTEKVRNPVTEKTLSYSKQTFNNNEDMEQYNNKQFTLKDSSTHYSLQYKTAQKLKLYRTQLRDKKKM